MLSSNPRNCASLLAAGLVGASVFAATNASADYPVGIDLVTQLPPFEGESDVDDVELDGRRYDPWDDDEDLEENLGVAGHYLFEVSPGLGLGPRGMLLGSEGDDSNWDYNTFDASFFVRYTFDSAKVLPFINGGAGLTYLEVDGDDDWDGLGWHISGGGGCGFPVGKSIAIYAGLLVHRQAVHVSGEVDPNDVDFDMDVVLTRVLTTVGVGF